MALITLAADKGSPGVTTTALALAATWPRRSLLVEADPAGGDLVYRSSPQTGGTLDPNIGMLSLAATARRGLAAEQLWDHTQRLSGGLDVLVGLGGAEQAVGLSGHWGTLGRACVGLGEVPTAEAAADVLADCGRIGPDAPTLELVRHAAMVLLVTRTEPEQLARVRDRAAALSATLHGGEGGHARLGGPLVGVLVVGDAHDGAKVAGQVNNMLIASNSGARVVGLIADDPAGAEQLAGRRRGRVERSLLIRSVRKVVTDLQRDHAAAMGPHVRPGSGGPGPAVPADTSTPQVPQQPPNGGAPPYPQGGQPPAAPPSGRPWPQQPYPQGGQPYPAPPPAGPTVPEQPPYQAAPQNGQTPGRPGAPGTEQPRPQAAPGGAPYAALQGGPAGPAPQSAQPAAPQGGRVPDTSKPAGPQPPAPQDGQAPGALPPQRPSVDGGQAYAATPPQAGWRPDRASGDAP